ncbi:TPR domain-containing glycosyltransferase [Brevibacillus laterosporus]|uniref:Glycosyltransferase n=1 Tax=Brevibacillus laterosporus TaxID=1465 RepID=A0AAP3GAK5_BRELA|nr:TPR domain-containing glycosyltransferase [Brevibacillus laterosporus]MCR8979982.1 glycosyltransferase [Brevibacillus laterosporus]MCZ0807137.1 glycosyltransferase [Brevibacillus laterosporus]MCZ0825466.1 glycosyltransferase [Brevibacillus laterosporus]MCZ0849115.1 glycosyltransferase [Brevibacillus laterosporus]
MTRLKISLCMIVCDEEEHLERCLSSAADTVSEIIIVDTGSQDRSIEIARSYGAKVISIPWRGDFSEARNLSLEYATEPWILVLDADEEWVVPSKEQLIEMMEAEGAFGYYVQLQSFVGATGEEFITDGVCRFFQNDDRLRFRGITHEEIATCILEVEPEGVRFSPMVVKHYSYLDHVIAQKNKAARNVSLIQKALLEKPDDPVLIYALGSEFFQQEEYQKARVLFETLLTSVPHHVGYMSDVLLKLAFSYKEMGNTKEAQKITEEALRFYPDFVDMIELQAILHIEENQLDSALELLQQATLLGDVSHKYTSCSGSGTYRSLYIRGLLYERLLSYEKACHCYEEALAFQPQFNAAWQRLIRIRGAFNQIEELINQLQLYKGKLSTQVQSSIVQYLMEVNQPQWFAQYQLLLPDAYTHNPLWKGIFLAQLRKEDLALLSVREAQQCFHSQMQADKQLEADLLQWAILLQIDEYAQAYEIVLRLAQRQRGYQALFGWKPGQIIVLSPPIYQSCSRALLAIGAWEKWIDLYRSCSPLGWTEDVSDSFAIALLRAPQSIQLQFLQMFLLETHLSPRLLQIAGVLAILCEKYDEATTLFEMLNHSSTEKEQLIAQLGLLYSRAGLAKTWRAGILLEQVDSVRYLSIFS